MIALLRRPRLLLLDEVTSQLDAVNEAALRDTIADAATTTTVLVAHRLSTVTIADRIIVMDTGQVRAMGTHRTRCHRPALRRTHRDPTAHRHPRLRAAQRILRGMHCGGER
jgi:ABC-type bacteriocin/lantibiotic exporter with double-glycine peptidase domain